MEIGGFVANNNYANVVIDNCFVVENSSISVDPDISDTSVGAIIGESGSNGKTLIKNSGNSANLYLKSYGYVSSIIGSCQYEYATIYNSYNIVNINSNNYSYVFSNANLINSYNTGGVNGVYGTSLLDSDRKYENTVSLGGEYANKKLNWKNKTYSFESNGGSEVESVNNNNILTTLPTPEKEGYYFYGWYDNKELSGEPISAPYYSETDITLYAKYNKIIEDISNMITNDDQHPWIEQDGVISSTNHHLDTSSSSEYIIKSNENIRIYFEWNCSLTDYINGDYNVYIYKYDEYGYLNSSYCSCSDYTYYELKPGEYIRFYIYNNQNSTRVLNVKNLVICKIN